MFSLLSRGECVRVHTCFVINGNKTARAIMLGSKKQKKSFFKKKRIHQWRRAPKISLISYAIKIRLYSFTPISNVKLVTEKRLFDLKTQ